MARQKVKNVIELNSWNEVDEALRQIGENNRDLTAIENVMNEQIASAKANADAKARPLKEQTALLELAIETFTRKNRNDMGKAKSKMYYCHLPDAGKRSERVEHKKAAGEPTAGANRQPAGKSCR